MACSSRNGSITMAGSSRCLRSAWPALPIRSGCAAGLILGISSALSLAIGLEMIIYIALAGAAMVLIWVDDVEEAPRLGIYAMSLSAGVALSFLLFASYDNRAAVCDALSPVYVSDAALGCGLMFALAWSSPADWKRRLALAVAAGAVIAAFHAGMWPQCLQKPEHISPEAQQLWMSHVKEARPIYMHGWRTASLILALPVSGAIGWVVLAWMRRSDRALLRRIIAVAVACDCSLAAPSLANPHGARRTDDGCGWSRRAHLAAVPAVLELPLFRGERWPGR